MDMRTSWENTAAETERQLKRTSIKVNFITNKILPIGGIGKTAPLSVLFCIILHDLKVLTFEAGDNAN
jgi:hypothetical protein